MCEGVENFDAQGDVGMACKVGFGIDDGEALQARPGGHEVIEEGGCDKGCELIDFKAESMDVGEVREASDVRGDEGGAGVGDDGKGELGEIQKRKQGGEGEGSLREVIVPEGREPEGRRQLGERVGVQQTLLVGPVTECDGTCVEFEMGEVGESVKEVEKAGRAADGAIAEASDAIWVRKVEDVWIEGLKAALGLDGANAFEDVGPEVGEERQALEEGAEFDGVQSDVLKGDLEGGKGRHEEGLQEAEVVVRHENVKRGQVSEDRERARDVLPEAHGAVWGGDIEDDGPHVGRVLADGREIETDEVEGNGDGEQAPDAAHGGGLEELAQTGDE